MGFLAWFQDLEPTLPERTRVNLAADQWSATSGGSLISIVLIRQSVSSSWSVGGFLSVRHSTRSLAKLLDYDKSC
jgi:hypothetical protein